MVTYLKLYVAVHVNDVNACIKENAVPRRLVGNRYYVGLRGSPDEAMQRAVEQTPPGTVVDKENFVILEVNFSEVGFFHYGTLPSGSGYYFQPFLLKMIYYKDKDTDWNVWHFNKDLPLTETGIDGTDWISTTWNPVV